MTDIFGIDVRGIVAEAISAAGNLQTGVMTRTTPGARDPDHPGRQRLPTTQRFTLQAIIESKAVRESGSGVVETKPVMTIIGGSIAPPATPAVNDTVLLAGITYTLLRLISADPAQAVFEFEVS